MRRASFLICGTAFALTGCDVAAAGGRASEASPIEAARDTRPERTRSASQAGSRGPASAATKLYQEVKGLDTACVAAGGGVSGSPDCDAAVAKGRQLEKLGYCIDYPNGEKLVRCEDLARRRRR